MRNLVDRAKTSANIQSLTRMARSDTARNSMILFIGNFINAILALITVIYVSRALGPENFGILATFNAVFTTLVGITNLGLDTAAIKLISEQLSVDKRRAAVTMKVIFKLEIVCGFLIALAGVIFADYIADILGGDHLTTAVRLAFLAGAFGSAAAFIGPFFVAYQQFTKNAVVGVAGGLIRVICVLILAATASLTLESSIWVYAGVPVIFFFVGLMVVPRDWMLPATRQEQQKSLKEIFHFSKWVLLSYVATVIAGKLDVFLLSRISGSKSVGLYAAALQLVSTMPMLIGAISTAVLPKFSQLTTREQMTSFFKKLVFGTSIIAAGLLLVIPFSDIIIHLVFGQKYEASIPAFKILYLAYIIALIGNTLSLALYATNRPKLLTYINYFGLISTLVFYPILITAYGIEGAAGAFLLNTVLGTVLSVGASVYAIRRYKSE